MRIFKHLPIKRVLSENVSYRIFNAYIRPYYQLLLNVYPLLSNTKQKHLEALNRQMYRIIHH